MVIFQTMVEQGPLSYVGGTRSFVIFWWNRVFFNFWSSTVITQILKMKSDHVPPKFDRGDTVEYQSGLQARELGQAPKLQVFLTPRQALSSQPRQQTV